MLSFHVKFVQTDRQNDGQMDKRKTCPGSFDTGHKNSIAEMLADLLYFCLLTCP